MSGLILSGRDHHQGLIYHYFSEKTKILISTWNKLRCSRVDGWYQETTALTCGEKNISMPLGVIVYGKQAYFRVFKNTRFYRLLRYSIPAILLFLPEDPLIYYQSINHSLESNPQIYASECPIVELPGKITLCNFPMRICDCVDYDWYTCSLSHQLEYPNEMHVGYSRAYGCLLELLVYYTKVKAHVSNLPGEEYVNGLVWCIMRSSRNDRRLMEIVEKILKDI